MKSPFPLPNPTQSKDLNQLESDIVTCQKCPRLVEYIAGIRKQFPSYWCKPVPGFGDANARILLLGLAPGRYGSNRTGRMFTGDASGRFLFPLLFKAGLSSQAEAESESDGLALKDTFITAIGRCAPPQNKPTPQEIKNCIGYVQKEMALLPRLKAVVALGKIAHDGYLNLIGERKSQFPFKHGAQYSFAGHPTLLDTYHPSRQNTNTGVLNEDMFLNVLLKAKALAAD